MWYLNDFWQYSTLSIPFRSMMKAGKSDLSKPDRYARLFLESSLIGSDTTLNDLLSFQFK
jgi:hypothetical protein